MNYLIYITRIGFSTVLCNCFDLLVLITEFIAFMQAILRYMNKLKSKNKQTNKKNDNKAKSKQK